MIDLEFADIALVFGKTTGNTSNLFRARNLKNSYSFPPDL